MRDYLGHAVINGVMQYASVSSVKVFDPRTKAGCPRRWWFAKIGGKKEVEKESGKVAKEKGLKLDAELKHYLSTGEKNVSALALKGLHILEAPGPDLRLDLALHSVSQPVDASDAYRKLGIVAPERSKHPIISSALTAAGIPFVGELDVAHERGHYRDDDGEYHDDPPGTVEVIDIKFKTNAKDRDGNSTLFMPSDLVRDIQMAGYGEWVGRVRPNTSYVRLSHAYYPEKGALPTKVTKLHVLDDCHKTWEYVEGVVRSMVDVAKETDVEKVPGNTASCDTYAGCPHREYCTAYRRNSLDSLYNKIATDFAQGEQPVGLIAQTQPQLMQQAATTQQQLAQEEQQMRAQVAQQQAQMPQQLNTADLAAVCQRLGSYGYGFPSLAGNAAQAYAVLGGQAVAPGFVYQGIMAPPGARRSLHQVQLFEVGHIFQLEGELAAERGTAQQAAQPMQPPMQPYVQQQPQQQYAPVQVQQTQPAFTQQVAAQYNQNIAAQQPTSFLPPGAPESMPQLASPQTAPAPQSPEQIVQYGEAPKDEKPKGSRGRPKKSQDAAPESAAPPAAQIAAPAAAPPTAPATQVAPAATSALYSNAALNASAGPAQTIVLINARVTGRPSKSLADYVDYINAELSKRYSITDDGKPGIQDVRCVPKNSPLAFGGWKGAVREIVKSGAGLDTVEGLVLHLDTFMDELNEAVADALRVVAEQRGWLYVRAVRG